MPKKVNRKFLMADFETSTEKWLERDNGVARVWLWGLYDIETNEFEWGKDLESFLSRTLRVNRNGQNPIIYFHNLKYDGSYIVNYLLSHDYKYDEELSSVNSFRTSISDMGQWYFVEVCIYLKKYGDNYQKVIIRYQDSLKKIVLPVRDIPKAFGFEEEEAKGDIDYDMYRPVGYEPTEEELFYILRDLTIPARALKILEQEGFNKMTTSGDAFEHWKKSLQSEKARERNIPVEYTYRDIFPVLTPEQDAFLRRAYRGGWTYVNPKYQGKILHDMEVYDINSMYPAKLRDKYLPCGTPKYFTGEPSPNKYQCYVVRVLMEFSIKKDHLPCIQLKHSYFFNPTEYALDSDGHLIEMVLTNIDLKLIFKQYHVKKIFYLDGYYFRKAKGYFTNFIDENMKIKETSSGGRRTIAKRRMNSVYGKTATSPSQRSKIPYLDNGVLKFYVGEAEERSGEYLAIGLFTTSHARYDIITDAQNNYEHFVYCDTDSLHLLKSENLNLPIHATHIGFYKLEKKVSKAIFLRAKTYIEEDYYGEAEIKCAGANEAVKANMDFDNFKSGQTFEGKIMPKQVKGGCVLVNTTFTIS